jgi:molybdopterin-containing oxidoreductase family iron-sulfur binding subunit
MDLIQLSSRRDFLRHAAGGAVAAGLATREALGAATEPERKHHWGMVIDTRRCVGCEACVIACKLENMTPPGVYYTIVTKEPLPGSRNDRPVFMTKPCFHCDEPPCVPVCPVSATYKRKTDGIVVVDYDRCIGCRYCVAACPYGARYFDFGDEYELGSEAGETVSPEYKQFRERVAGSSPIGNVRKCTFCLHLQDENGEYDRDGGRWPACAKTCPGHAIHFGDLDDPESEVSIILRERNAIRLKEELGTHPSVYYLF